MINPLIFEKTKDGEVLYDIFSRLIKERILFLAQELDVTVASSIAATLIFLDSQDQETPINLYINSPGGDLEALFTIYDVMNMIKAPIHTYCIGMAASAAAVLLSAGSKGGRYAMPNSRVMIHQLQVSEMYGTATAIKNEAKVVEEYNNKVFEVLARHSGQPIKKVEADCQIDHYMTAEQALKYGIVDKIVKPTKDIPKLKEVRKNRRRKKEVPVESDGKPSGENK